MRVAILPTGWMEWHALARSLANLFPEHTFYSIPSRNEIASNGDEYPVYSITSADITKSRPGALDAARKLVQRAAKESLAGADLVLLLDDLELPNVPHPGEVIEIVRAAATLHLESCSTGIRKQTAKALRERVSFHLAKPMIEAWLFASSAALKAAGLPRDQAPRIGSADYEDFATDDVEYSRDQGEGCPCWLSLPANKQRAHRPAWLIETEARQRHPKAYLCWLCRSGTEKSCTAYRETRSGKDGLLALEWGLMLGDPATMRFARALVEDIEDCAGIVPKYHRCPGEVSPLTSARSNLRAPSSRILRNL